MKTGVPRATGTHPCGSTPPDRLKTTVLVFVCINLYFPIVCKLFVEAKIKLFYNN